MNERGCLQVSSWEVPPVERGRRKEGPCSDLSLPLPCNPACFWSSIAGDVIPLPYPRSKETVWAADVCVSSMWCTQPASGCTQAQGFLVSFGVPDTAGRSRPAWSSPDGFHQRPLVLSNSQTCNLCCELWLTGLPFWNLPCWRLGGKAQLALGPLRRWHHWAEAQGRSGALLCVCSDVSGWRLWGHRVRAAPLERGTMTCDVHPSVGLVGCVSLPCD